MNDEIKKPDEESIAAFFYGLIRNAGIWYDSIEGGSLQSMFSHEKLVRLGHMFFKKLQENYFKTITLADIEEICWEIDWWKTLEYWTWKFWKMCITFQHTDTQIEYVATRDFPLRTITEEMSMSYLIGLSWFLHRDIKDRETKLDDFLLEAKKTLAPNMTRERLFELESFYWNDQKIEEYRLVGYEMLDMRKCLRGK